MIVEKLMMPFILASQHYMVNLAFFVTSLIVYFPESYSDCYYRKETHYYCLMDDLSHDLGLNNYFKKNVYIIVMCANFVSFLLHYIARQL